jgi:myosin-15
VDRHDLPYIFTSWKHHIVITQAFVFTGTATVCLQNLRKTFKYGGRKNVPSVEEITAISAGRNSKRQIYRLPGGTERVVNTKSTTVVQVQSCFSICLTVCLALLP